MRKVIAGMIAGIVISATVGVFAAGGNVIEVFYNVKDIKVNKVSMMPEQKPFIYNGTTYVPLRFIGEALNQPVSWDGSTQTIYIGQMEEETAVYPGNGIEHMNYQTGWGSNKYEYRYQSPQKIKDNIGNEYDSYTIMYISRSATDKNQRWHLLEFPLNGQYKRFKANIGLTDKYKESSAIIEFDILIDGKNIYSNTFKGGDMPSTIDLDITNANKITFSMTKDWSNAEIGLFDARFIK